MNESRIIRDEELDYDSDLVFTLDGVPFTGIAYEETAQGRSEVSYREGVQEGPARDWYPSGSLKAESHYLENALHGSSKEFDQDGHLLYEASYEYGIRIEARRLARDGTVRAIEQLDPRGATARILEARRAERDET